MKDQLVFDTTDATSILHSDSVGAFVRAGTDGDLISSRAIGGGEHLDVYAALAAGDGTAITQTGGALDVNVASGTISITPEGIHLEDDAHASGDEGSFSLSIRLDDIDGANSALLAGAEGDYQGTFTNAKGEMWVKDADVLAELQGGIDVTITNDTDYGAVGVNTLRTAAQIGNATGAADFGAGNAGAQTLRVTLADDDSVDVNDAALANTAIAAASNTLGVADTAEDVVASPLANRKYLFIRNNSIRRVFIGPSGVTAANGFPISPGSVLEMRAGAAVDVEFVGASGQTPEIRTLELS